MGLIGDSQLLAQHVHMQLHINSTRALNKVDVLSEVVNGIALGGQLAVGTNRFQVGVEAENGFSVRPFFGEIPDTTFESTSSFLGGFIRANFSSIPAYRLGFVAKIGAGLYEDDLTRMIVGEENMTIRYPKKILGYNAGIGLSGPIKKRFHWDFMYQLNYHQRPDLNTPELQIDQHNAWVHAFKFGMSMNLIFGKTKQQADEMISGRGW